MANAVLVVSGADAQRIGAVNFVLHQFSLLLHPEVVEWCRENNAMPTIPEKYIWYEFRLLPKLTDIEWELEFANAAKLVHFKLMWL